MANNKRQSYIGVFDKNNANKFYNIYTSDASIKELRTFIPLPANALIVSSPISETNSCDLGTPAIVMTDSYGTPVPLTYTFANGIFTFNEETNTVNIGDADSLQKTIEQFKKEIEEIKNSVSGTIEYKFNKLCSSKSFLSNADGRKSIVSYIDNTTYSLKLEEWTNQKLTISNGASYYHDITIPGPIHSSSNNYVFTHYGNFTECSICLGYTFDSTSSFELVKRSYSNSYGNNNCIEYITNYSLLNTYFNEKRGNSFLTVDSSSTGLAMNNIIADSSYVKTKPIYGEGAKRVGSYTFLRFPLDNVPNGSNQTITLQVEEGNKCVASNICTLTIGWHWDKSDYPTTVRPSTTAYPPSTTTPTTTMPPTPL